VRALKILVIVMGVLLVGGFAALIVVIASRVAHRQPAAASSAPFQAAPVNLPSGARIETIGVGADRLVLDVVEADGGRQLIILDLATGRRLGTIPLRNMP
jgi:hypothetical protein